MAIVDLTPDVVEVLDYETILAERKATLVSLYPEEQQGAVARTLILESEPIVKLLEENAYRELSGDSASTRPRVRSCWLTLPEAISTRLGRITMSRDSSSPRQTTRHFRPRQR